MAVLWSIFLPAVVFAHVLGGVLLLYSLEKVSGVVSKSWKRVFGRNNIKPDESLSRNSETTPKGGPTEEPEAAGHKARNLNAWRRGCTCEEGCYCVDRWVQRNKKDIEAGSTTASHLAVQYPADLAWFDVTCHVLDQKTLKQKQVLHPSSGNAYPGECVALLGPSGAGKSTLLDILSLRKSSGKIKGQVLMNGRPLGVQFKRNSAYVAQEDCFVPTMSAWETLNFTATLTLPKAISPEERRTRITEVLKIMGLWRSRDTQVGGALPGGILVRGLSGGEKRRLNIACALISAPSILFLDEPTTGLDSFAALNVMEHMSNLADLGHTIIASIHQPRSAIWDMFDKCVVLSEGHNLYFGSPKRALDWFSDALGYSYSYQRDGAVSDWLMDLVSVGFQKPTSYRDRSMCSLSDVQRAAAAFSKERSEERAERGVSGRASPSKPSTPRGIGRQGSAKVVPASATAAGGPVRTRSSMGKAGSIASLEELEAVGKAQVKKQMEWASGKYAASWWTQFRILLNRALLGQLRNPTDTTSRLFLSTWVGCLAGLAFYDLPSGPDSVTRRLALLFFILLLFELLPFCYMSFYVADRRFFAADISNDLYHPSAYYLSSVIASIPFVIINSLCGCLCAYGLAGLRLSAHAVLLNLCITALQSMISIQLQVFCVWLTPNQDLAYVLATGYVAASILLSGFYLRIDDMKLAVMRGLSYLSYTKYAMEAVSKLELSGILYPPCPQTFGNALPQGAALGPGAGGADAAQLAAMQNGAAAAGQAPAQWSPPAVQNWQQSPSQTWTSPDAGSWWQSPPPNGRAWSPASFGRRLLDAATGADSQVVQIASGGLTPHCNTTGDDLLDFWGYKLSIGTCVGILVAFYVVFHVGSYFALSKLYKQKR
ncbi:ABC transporter G family member 22 [Coccomyxa sp. Obi]|nr:ABC transporter G family member 22 [Coccomyxa sp. Obi]